MSYVATINVPGYLPMDDDPPTFDTAQEAWEYLAGERERSEDDFEGDSYSETREKLAVLGTAAHWHNVGGDEWVREWLTDAGLAPDGTGTVYGDAPGYDGDHDLGLAYSVSIVEPEQPS